MFTIVQETILDLKSYIFELFAVREYISASLELLGPTDQLKFHLKSPDLHFSALYCFSRYVLDGLIKNSTRNLNT